jgi:hypothetical protein
MDANTGFVSVFQCSSRRCLGTGVLRLDAIHTNGKNSTSTASKITLYSATKIVVPTLLQCQFPRSSSADNFLCGKCVNGLQDINGKCVECKKTNGGYVALGIFLGMALIAFVYWLSLDETSSGDTTVAIYYTQITLQLAGPMDGWASWLGFLSLTTNSNGYGTPCAIYQDDVAQNLLMPFFQLLLLYALSIMMSVTILLLHKFAPHVVQFRVSTEALVRTFIGVTLFSYTDVAAAAFSSFGCVWVDGKNLLYYFPSIDCSSASYTSAYNLQIFIVIFFVIGVPLATVLCSWWYYNSVIVTIPGLGQTGRAAFCADSLDSATTSSEHFISAKRYFSWWGPLFSYFTKEAFFYQGLVLGRRTVYSMATIVLEPSINLRAMVYGFSSFVFLVIHTLLAPYRDDMLNKVESISLSLHVFVSILISPWEPPFPLEVQVSLCFFVVVPTVFFVGWRTKSMLLEYRHNQQSAGVAPAVVAQVQRGYIVHMAARDRAGRRGQLSGDGFGGGWRPGQLNF